MTADHSPAIGARKYRILHLLPSLHVGGVGKLLLQTVSGLRNTRFEPVVAYFAPPTPLASQFDHLGVAVYHLHHRGSLSGATTLNRLRRLMRSLEVDAIHTHLALDRLYGGMAAYLEKKPSVTTLHWSTRADSRINPLTRFIWERGLRVSARHWTDQFIAVSSAVRDYQVALLGIPDARVTVIYPGVDTMTILKEAGKSSAQRLRGELQIPRTARILLNVGRLVPDKGQRYLVEMLRYLPEDVVLLIAGTGTEKAYLLSRAEELSLGDRVRLLGIRHDIPTLLGLADVFVFPSTGEGFGVAALEAMASGTPVVASRIPALEELVRDGVTGLLVEPRDPVAFASAVKSVLYEPTQAALLSANAREDARDRFDTSVFITRLEEVYRSLVAPRSSR